MERGGITTLAELLALNRRELMGLGGIGPSALLAIEASLTANGLELAGDEWLPYTCARDGAMRWDTSLSSFFLCDSCVDAFTKVLETMPEYTGTAVHGFCDHCNLPKEVRQRQWLLCGVCYRVLKSIGRSIVAARYFREFWDREIGPRLAEIELLETDAPELRRRSAGPGPDAAFDFLAVDKTRGKPAFGFELKTGRSHLGKGGIGSGMSQFQLDTGDCDDMSASITAADAPGYLVNIQVVDRAEPPTVRFAAVGMWWVDMFTMAAGFREKHQRPRENRPAAYFDAKMFQPSTALADHLAGGGPSELLRRIRTDGVPALYR